VILFDDVRRAAPAALRVGQYAIQLFEQGLPDQTLALFRDSHWVKSFAGFDLFDNEYYDYSLIATVGEVTARLELYGFCESSLGEVCRLARIDINDSYISDFRRDPEWSARMQQLCADVKSPDDLVPLLGARIDGDLSAASAEEARLPFAPTFIERILNRDPRLILWLCARARPDASVTLDVSGLAPHEGVDDWAEGTDGQGWCAAAVERLSGGRAVPPVIVLTEGKTDSEFISAAISILRPEVADLVRFLDPDAKPNQSASMLAKTVVALVSAGIANPIVALFDNDTAGHKEYDWLRMKRLPSSVTLAVLPNILLAERYPSLLPPQPDLNSVTVSNVNGFACGIEMYLGTDALMLDGKLEPVLWSNYESSSGKYQGSLRNKGRVQDAYREKVKKALMDPGAVSLQDWTGMTNVIETILRAAARSAVQIFA
jgi:hypothetical protein